MFNEDYSFLTGNQADLDGDGNVDLEEYLNDEDDFERIYGDDGGDDDFSFDDEDFDEDF